MHAETSTPIVDWIVLTAANRRQAAAYEAALAARQQEGRLPHGAQCLVIADARDERIGSGAATILALAALAEKMLQQPRSTKVKRLRDLFANRRVLIMHSGGDSRRLPMYAVQGKLFATLPLDAGAGRAGAVFDLLLDDLLTLPRREGGEVLLAAGDCVLGIKHASVQFRGTGIVGVAARAPAERATRHGVYVLKGRAKEVVSFLQKPSIDAMRAANALAKDNSALVDTGLMSLDSAAVEALLLASGVSFLTADRIALRKGSLAERAARADLSPLDLYREMLCALPRAHTLKAYLKQCDRGNAPLLRALYKGLRRTRFACEVSSAGEFLHIGTTRELLGAVVGNAAVAKRFAFDARSIASASDGTCEGAALFESAVGTLNVARDRVVLDLVHAKRLDLGGENVLVGVDTDTLLLPHGVSVCVMPVIGGRAAICCGIEDDFKTPLDRGGTFLGKPFAEFAAQCGLRTRDLVAAHGALWDAKLWRVGGETNPLDAIAWMWEGKRPPKGWSTARRVNMRELLLIADAAGLEEKRASRALRWLAQDEKRSRDAVAQTADPVLRASLAARLSQEFRVAGNATRAMTLRDAAFRAVSDTVLSRFDLPEAPQRAAILVDQAVWTSTPVRIDLAGGWTDTPPICNEVGGSVVNVAVTLRGQLPTQVVAKLEEELVVRITSTDLGETRVIRSMADLDARTDPTRWSSLAENALVLCGAVPSDPRASLTDWLAEVGGGVSLTMFSAVPKGSGLGTSSILGAATIYSLERVFGRDCSHAKLFTSTSALEQMLSTRGGWQDQVGGVLGGFKIARTSAGTQQIPVAEAIVPPRRLLDALQSRAILYFTGERRMAKNILETVVWNWLIRKPSARRAVEELQHNARRMRSALRAGSVDDVVEELALYMRLKRTLDEGCCPPMFDALSARWKSKLAAASFAGAGGGGFMLLIAKDAKCADALRADIARTPQHPRARAFPFEVDPVGIRCAVL
ncbi:MAG: hypothetical protein EXS10_07965 [Phycisphaerales bacterium]|nr:hypothetical protein [Phycisphaerales bacterium]